MWIKLLIGMALFALLVWAARRLITIKHQEKNFRRNHREPLLNSKQVSYDDLEVISALDADLEDNDEILGIKVVTTVKPVEAIKAVETIKPVENVSQQQQAPVEKPKAPVALVINLMSPKAKPYIGYELLQALLAVGLRYGDMNIFHRHENKNGIGAVLFHLASANSPGTFELSKMGSFSCPGLTLFMQLNDRLDNAANFEAMLDTANELQAELGGELWDESRKTLSMDKITEYRLRIRDYQEANRVPDFFEQYQES